MESKEKRFHEEIHERNGKTLTGMMDYQHGHFTENMKKASHLTMYTVYLYFTEKKGEEI